MKERNEILKVQEDRMNHMIGSFSNADEILKAEGSRGGKIIGHTRSGKPIYASMAGKDHKNLTHEDHRDATELHLKEARRLQSEGKDVEGKVHWNEAWKHDRIGNRKEIQTEDKK